MLHERGAFERHSPPVLALTRCGRAALEPKRRLPDHEEQDKRQGQHWGKWSRPR
ncbi:MAG: hypothetical protein AB7S81_05475 [Bdellovibrionales bacterium]